MIYTQQYKVIPQEVDFTCRQSLPSLGNFLLDAASLSAATFGLGLNDLSQRGLTWVVSRLHISLKRNARLQEVITIDTWPRDCNRLASARYYRITGDDGTVIGNCTSLWSVINFETRRPVDLLTEADLRPFITEQEVDTRPPMRIDELHTEPIATHTVRYSDLDFNVHTNSMKYVQWMLDTLPLEQFQHRHIAAFDINYAHEARFGQEIKILRNEIDGGYHFDLKSDENKSFCKAKILFEND